MESLDALGAMGTMRRADRAIIAAMLARGANSPFSAATLSVEAQDHWTGEQRADWWLMGQTVAGFIRRFRNRFEDVMVRRPGGWYALTPRGVEVLRYLTGERQSVRVPSEVAHQEATRNHNIGGSADMSRINRLMTAARVYLKSGPTVYLTAAAPDAEGKIAQVSLDDLARDVRNCLATEDVIDGITTDGDRVQIPAGNIADVIYPTQVEQVVPPASVFEGKRIQVRNLEQYAKENPSTLNGMTLDGALHEYTVVTGEDMAEAEIVVLNVATGQVMWENPASPPEANQLVVQAAMLLAEAEERLNLAYHEQEVEAGIAKSDDRAGEAEDQANALAQLDAGNVRAAINIAGAAFVEAFLAEAASGPDVCVRIVHSPDGDDGAFGVINGFDPTKKAFQIDSFNGGSWWRRVDLVEEILSFSWEDYQRTGDGEQFLTEAGRSVVDQLPVPAN